MKLFSRQEGSKKPEKEEKKPGGLPKQKEQRSQIHITVPKEQYDEIRAVALEENTDMTELIRRSISLMIKLRKLEQSPDASIILRREGLPDERVMIII